jgi:hypothetical protein
MAVKQPGYLKMFGFKPDDMMLPICNALIKKILRYL